MKILQRLPFCLAHRRKCAKYGENSEFSRTKTGLGSIANAKCEKTRIALPLSCSNFRKMLFQSVAFLLHPIFFQIESKRKEEQFRPDIRLTTGQKTSESEIVLKQSKGSFRLD